ncbi:hypothetical protein ACWCOP_13615 [Maricaulaceae bacterium MS644]
MTLDRFSLACIAVGAIGAAAALGLLVTPTPEPPRVSAPNPATAPQVDASALAALTARLAPPQDAPEPGAPADRIALRLIGLVQSDEGRLAVLSDGARTYTVRPGDSVSGYEVLELDADGVRLQTPDGAVRLRLGGDRG